MKESKKRWKREKEWEVQARRDKGVGGYIRVRGEWMIWCATLGLKLDGTGELGY